LAHTKSERFQPRRGAGIKPGVLTPGTGQPTSPKPRRGAGNSIRTVDCLRPFGAPGKLVGSLPGVKTPGFMPAPPAGAERQDIRALLAALPKRRRSARPKSGRETDPDVTLKPVSSSWEAQKLDRGGTGAPQRYPSDGELSAPAGGAGIKPGVSTPGSGPPPLHQKPRRGAGSFIRNVACLRPFGAPGIDGPRSWG
jgi:hypothetical protein